MGKLEWVLIFLACAVLLIVVWELPEICEKVEKVIRNRKKSTDRESE